MGILGIAAVITGIIFLFTLGGAAGCDLVRNLTDRADDDPPAKDPPLWMKIAIVVTWGAVVLLYLIF